MPQGCQFTDPALMVVGPWPWADSSSGAVLELIPREGKWLSNSLLTVDVRESVGFLLCTRKLDKQGWPGMRGCPWSSGALPRRGGLALCCCRSALIAAERCWGSEAVGT